MNYIALTFVLEMDTCLASNRNQTGFNIFTLHHNQRVSTKNAEWAEHNGQVTTRFR